MGSVKKKKNIHTSESNITSNNADILPFPGTSVDMAFYTISSQISALRNLSHDIRSSVLSSLLAALKCKDLYTFQHSLRVGHYSQLVGKALGMEEKDILDLETSSVLHDIGKIGVQEQILNKPERLTEEEFAHMKNHPSSSGVILSEIEVLSHLAVFVRHHHERFDGRGYPDKLKGDEIPTYSRIILISDTFDSMTSDRPYRKGLGHENSFKELEEFSGSQFDSDLVKTFIKVVKKEQKRNKDDFKLFSLDTTFKKVA